MYNQLSLLGKKIQATWSKILQGDVSSELIDNLAEKVDSKKDKETFSFTYLFSKIREWIDSAIYETGKQFEYIIKHKKWQVGFQIDNDTKEDIKADSVLSADLQLQIKSLANEFPGHKEELINDALELNGNAFDKTAFFADSRPNIVDGENLDNIATGSGITIANIATDIQAAMIQLDAMKIKKKALNKNAQFLAVVPTHLYMLFNRLKTVDRYYNGATDTDNDLKNTFKIIKNYSQSTLNNDWYMVNTNSKMKPIILQKRQEPEMTESIDKDDMDVTKFNWKARYAVGYGNPFSIIFINNS